MASESLFKSLAFLLLMPALAGAQILTGSVTGVVTDPNGGAVVNSVVEVKNLGNGNLRQARTDDQGRYSVSQLLPGKYQLTVTAAGFKKFVTTEFSLEANQTAEQNAALELGTAAQTVEVSASAAVLDTQTATKNVTLTTSEVNGLPQNIRNPLFFAHATAGVVSIRTGLTPYQTDQNQGRYALNGGRDEAGALLVDGVSISGPDWGGAIATPGQDMVAEVHVVRTAYDAQYGRTDGGVVDIITKGGTESFHGSGFEFVQNDHLNANSFGANRAGIPKNVFQRNQFGGTLGGPIWRSKKLFFLGGYDGLRQAVPQGTLTTVPTLLQRQGDFSQTFNPDGSLAVIYNPFSTTPNANGTGYTRTPFPGNRIPAEMIDPVGSKAVELYPEPNFPGLPITNAGNFTKASKLVSTFNKMDIRADWVKSEKFSIFGRLTKGWQTDSVPIFFGKGADSTTGESDPRNQVVLSATWVPSPTWVINFLGGWGRWHELDTTSSSGHPGTEIGLPAATVAQFATDTLPQFNVSDYAQLAYAEFAAAVRENRIFQVNATKELSSHSLRFGVNFDIGLINSADQTSAIFNFDRGLTSGPDASTNSSTSGNSIASLLLGTGSGGDAPYSAQLALAQKNFAWYVQDTWRVSRRLTVTAGIRHEIQGARTERYNRLNYFATKAASPLAAATGLNLTGGLVFDGSDKRGLWDTDYLNFAPRISVAYKITDKLVFRSGFGIFNPAAVAVSVGTSDGYSTDTSWVSTVGGGGLIPANLISNPFPQGLNQPAGSSLGLLTGVGQTVNAFQRYHPTPYVQSFSADFQYQVMRNGTLEVGYSGTQGRKQLMGMTTNINQLDPQYLSMGDALNDQVPNPFFNVISNGPLSGPAIPRWRLLVPYPQFDRVLLSGDTPAASSSFNALLVKYNQRLTGGLSAIVTYQWSRAIDDASETQAWEIRDALRDVYHRNLDRSISAHDVPQDFTATSLWEIPVGRNKKFGKSMNRIADAAVGGWQLATIVRIASGLPLQFSAPNSLGVYGFAAARPNISSVGALAVSNPTPERWFNTSVVSSPDNYTIGNAPRWLPNVRTGHTRNADFSLAKSFHILEQLRLQIRAEAFNVTNTPQFSRADTRVSDSGFGTNFGTFNVNPRIIQLGARLDF